MRVHGLGSNGSAAGVLDCDHETFRWVIVTIQIYYSGCDKLCANALFTGLLHLA
jgi:hypothetical protein